MNLRIASLLLIGLLSVAAAKAQQAPLDGLDEYVTKTQAEWQIPGLAIAVVKDDKVVFAKGYGVRKLGEPATVDEQTAFAIGSATKAFTAAALAMLVDEGKIKWDDPVTKYLRDFQLFDPYVTREITVRDLLCHRSGLDRAEHLWYGANLTRTEILYRLRFQKPSWSFRSRFGYNNLMFVAAGEIIPAVTGKSWEQFVKERILQPLEMRSSTVSSVAAKNFANLAAPHRKIDGRIQTVPWYDNDQVAAAGSIYANVIDMAQWLRLQLAQGSYGDKKLLSLGAVQEMHSPQIMIPFETVAMGAPDAHFAAYGLGWFLYDYHGRKVVRHGGNIDGMVATLGMIPEERLGVVILSNLDFNDLPTALMFRVFDAYLGLPPQDWSKRMLTIMRIAELRRKGGAEGSAVPRLKSAKPAMPLAHYVGTYHNDLYGDAKVILSPGANGAQDQLRFFYNEGSRGELEPWGENMFRLRWTNDAWVNTFATFTLDATGQVLELKVKDFDDFKRVQNRER